MGELNRLSSHLVWFGTQGLDMGAMSAMFYGFREREVILDFYEMVTGLRMNNGYIIPGGVWEDLPDGWRPAVESILALLERRIDEYEELLYVQSGFPGTDAWGGGAQQRGCLGPGRHWPDRAGVGHRCGISGVMLLTRSTGLHLRCPHRDRGRRLRALSGADDRDAGKP